MAVEKRKERRIRVGLPIKIIYQNNIEVAGKTENISRLGAYVEIDREIPLGVDVDVTLDIPEYSEGLSLTGGIRCSGNIFRCHLARESELKKYYGVGVFFTDFSPPTDKDKLSRYIDFLILKEEKDVREGIKRWRGKREVNKITKQAPKTQAGQEKFQIEALNLLKQILSRLEEISHLLQSQNKTK